MPHRVPGSPRSRRDHLTGNPIRDYRPTGRRARGELMHERDALVTRLTREAKAVREKQLELHT